MAFKAITVNTPAADPAHILAEDDAALYESLVGGDKVLNVGGKLAATTISNNKIRITDGVVIVGGHVGRIYKGDYEDLTIENGTSGQNRNDLIVARYLAGNSGGADSYGLAVIKGTPGSTATDPIYMQGNLYNGDPQRDFPLYRAKLEGLSIVAVEQLFEVGKTIGELEEEIETLNSNMKNAMFVEEYNLDNQSLAANSTDIFEVPVPVIERYARGSFETSVYNATSSGSGSSFCTVYQQLVSGNNVRVAIRNNSASAARIKINVRMTYILGEFIAQR
ncbi:hypothetical protein [Massilistercora timonensis]|uniref:hypothetical protein n=1 Tax=Massilistercora timonensis TaxID=2086584 RepID=UPI003AB1B84D